VNSGDAEIEQMVAEWCASVAPRGEDSTYDICVSLDGSSAAIRSGEFEHGTIHSSGCLQDLLLSALAFSLEQEGVLSLSDPVGELLHELHAGTAPGGAIRVGDLMCHASGLRSPGEVEAPAAYHDWSTFWNYMTALPVRFPPGSVIHYDIVERVLLVEYLRRATSENPYRIIEERYLQGVNASFLPSERHPVLGLENLHADVASLCTVIEPLVGEAGGWFEHACRKPDIGSVAIFDPLKIGKDFVPTVNSCGILDFGNFLWGQNGTSNTSFLGARFDEHSEMLVVGAFQSKYERDLIMNEMCDRLGYSTGDGHRSRKIGSLAGFPADQLVGSYEGASRGPLEISLEGDEIRFGWPQSDSDLRCRVKDDGTLVAGFAWPGLWLEPFAHPSTGADCLMVAQMSAVKI